MRELSPAAWSPLPDSRAGGDTLLALLRHATTLWQVEVCKVVFLAVAFSLLCGCECLLGPLRVDEHSLHLELSQRSRQRRRTLSPLVQLSLQALAVFLYKASMKAHQHGANRSLAMGVPLPDETPSRLLG